MDYKKLFLTYDGRINRQPFWLGGIALSIVNLIVEAIINGLFGQALIGSILTLVIALAFCYPSMCLLIKRYHDRDKSGWWCFIILIPIIGVIWNLIETGFLRETAGHNRFGPNPLESKMA